MTVNQPKTFYSLTLTRWIAALCVVYFHFGTTDKSSWSGQLNLAVSYFFVLSGFVMVVAHQHENRLNFWYFIGKRLARIYPLYLLALIVFSMINWVLHHVFSLPLFAINALLLESWIPGKALSYHFPGWSLSTEFFFYLSFPFIWNRIFSKYTLQKMLVLTIVVWLASQCIFEGWINEPNCTPLLKETLPYFPLLHLNQFLWGCLGGLLFINWPLKRDLGMGLFIMLNIIYGIAPRWIPFSINGHNGWYAPLFAGLIVGLALLEQQKSFPFLKRIQLLGNASYGIYIFQLPVYTLFHFALQKHIPNQQLGFWVYVLILQLVALACTKWVEKPAQKWVLHYWEKWLTGQKNLK
jgi:peptidoglycan/LPS O-acetylase OafA/YrhL